MKPIDWHWLPPDDAEYYFSPKIHDEFAGYSIFKREPPLLTWSACLFDKNQILEIEYRSIIQPQHKRCLHRITAAHDVNWKFTKHHETYNRFEAIYYDRTSIDTNHVYLDNLVALYSMIGDLETIIRIEPCWTSKKSKTESKDGSEEKGDIQKI